jgi:gas vesicle protein
MTMSESNAGSNAAFFLVGLGMGAIIALLMAPKSGQETRDLIAQKASEGRDYLTTRGKEYRRQAEGYVDKARDVVSKQKDQLSAALEAGKQAYQEEKGRSR